MRRQKKSAILFCIIGVALIIVLAGVGPAGDLVPWSWQIKTFITIYPLALVLAFHLLLPIMLNPGLMMFTW